MGYDEHSAEGYAVGVAIGYASQRAIWLAWVERRKKALAAGIPFDEPPPQLDD